VHGLALSHGLGWAKLCLGDSLVTAWAQLGESESPGWTLRLWIFMRTVDSILQNISHAFFCNIQEIMLARTSAQKCACAFGSYLNVTMCVFLYLTLAPPWIQRWQNSPHSWWRSVCWSPKMSSEDLCHIALSWKQWASDTALPTTSSWDIFSLWRLQSVLWRWSLQLRLLS
jgi:hypothetical protein